MKTRTRDKRSRVRKGSAVRHAATAESLAAADFKARCLELMDRVRETGTEYVITKHGRPVAKLVPYLASARSPFFGSGKGSVLHYDRPFDPIDGSYGVNEDA
jgi:prevent-host-death family protein